MKMLKGQYRIGAEASSRQDKEDDLFGMVSNMDERYAKLPDTPPAIACKFCGKPLKHTGVNIGSRIIWAPTPELCTCPDATDAFKKKKEIERRDKEERELRDRVEVNTFHSGMSERDLRCTFQNYQITDGNRTAATAARQYAEGFELLLPKRGEAAPGKNGLIIFGPPGTGKTHLAAAIANHLLAKGQPVICMTMQDLLECIKRTYSREDIDEGEVFKKYKTVPLLVIDDMGKEPPTEWAIATIYNIINGRYGALLPTIVTTNYDTDTLISRMTPRETRDSTTAQTIIDRLFEMCKGITLTGRSWRQR